MKLSLSNISSIVPQQNLRLPAAEELLLPEKVLQFGTGVLLRGLPDHFISIANSKGIFNGRIVVVKSTSNGGTDTFEEQDGLYTLCVRGIENGNKIDYDQVVSSISRVLSASGQWDEILQCASNPDMEIIISNTTEVGISMIKDNVHASPPQSFPGKLLAFLYHRFKIFNGDAEKGMVIVPTELIPGNGDKLLSIVLEQAHVHGFEIAFIEWLENSNHFCNSLVDRIVPGKFSKEQQQQNEQRLGYEDELMIMSESYALWAIQTADQKVVDSLSFAKANKEVILSADIDKFRDLKLRLLNGSHTFSCGLAVLAGFETVKQTMANEHFYQFINKLMNREIVDTIKSEVISETEAKEFSAKVLDRYSNPFIEHPWINICMNYSSKMLMRNIPLIENYQTRYTQSPSLMSLGMAGHILFMRSKELSGKYYGTNEHGDYLISDDNAALYHKAWAENGAGKVVEIILANISLWHTDLTKMNGLLNEVNYWLMQLVNTGALTTLQNIESKITVQ